MRRLWLAPVLVVLAIVLQLSVLNGLRLPGGGVPDLVLVLVAAIAMAEGPLAGMIIGFAAGLCLDLAPPGSLLIGQYALVFCLAGWAAGRLRSQGRSPLSSAVLMAIVVAVAEVLTTGIGLVLEPAQVTTAEIRDLLPSAIGYDLVLCPFVLYLVVVTGSLLTDGLAGVVGRAARSEHAGESKPRPHHPRLAHAAARTSDGWVAGHHEYRHARPPVATTRARLRPANGVAGSASGLARSPGRHPGGAGRGGGSGPVSLRLASSRRGDGAIGNSVGSGAAGASGRWQPGRHPGVLAGASRPFRPRRGQPGGSATWQHSAMATSAAAAGGSVTIRFSTHRGDATVGRALGSARLAALGKRSVATPRLRSGTGRSALTQPAGRPRVVPKVQFKSAGPVPAQRPVAAPTFRRRTAPLRLSGSGSGLVSGGVLDQATFRTVRRRAGSPRLRLATGRRASPGPGTGMLGGSGVSPVRLPRARIGKQPRFGYGRRSLLSYLAGRRVGGNWLARKRAGSRSGAWLIGKRTGGLR